MKELQRDSLNKLKENKAITVELTNSIHSFNTYLSSCYVPETFLGVENIEIIKTDKNPYPQKDNILIQQTINQ